MHCVELWFAVMFIIFCKRNHSDEESKMSLCSSLGIRFSLFLESGNIRFPSKTYDLTNSKTLGRFLAPGMISLLLDMG